MATIAQTLTESPLKSQLFPEIKQILFATDFSEASNAALPFAAALARAFQSELHLLHLLMPEMYQFLPPQGMPAAIESLESDASARMERLKTSSALDDIKVSSAEIMKGELGILLKQIQDRNIDLLVIVTHGRRGFRRLLLGSIAEEIIRHACCPVLTVGPHVHCSSTGEFHPKHVLFATDASPDSFRALPYAVKFANRECSDVILVHVLERGDAKSPEANAFAALMRESLHHTIPLNAIKSCTPEILVRFGDSVEQILDAARERESELIVMGARSGTMKLEKALSKGVSNGVIAAATCPVLTVRGRDL